MCRYMFNIASAGALCPEMLGWQLPKHAIGPDCPFPAHPQQVECERGPSSRGNHMFHAVSRNLCFTNQVFYVGTLGC